ncbi:unnamed protein product [Linum trigynum]|uniref:Gnk2-homologous domain-containing protein n=1 Tax=Linum trigynum TaxID=586398 RepID=A0AAV2DLE9_9ROSI
MAVPKAAATVIMIGMITTTMLVQGCEAGVVSEALCSGTLDPAVPSCTRKLAAELAAGGYGGVDYNEREQCYVNPSTTVYAQATCTSSTACGECLSEITAQLFNSCSDMAVGAQAHSSGCSFRYEISPF